MSNFGLLPAYGLLVTAALILTAFRDPADVMASPEKVSNFENTKRVMIDDIGLNRGEVEDHWGEPLGERIEDDIQPEVDQDAGPFTWSKYHDWYSMHDWLRRQVDSHTRIATLLNAGYSQQHRPLLGIKIAYKPNLPVVFVIAGLSAREWIGPPTAMWFIKEALKGANKTLKKYEWHVFPLVNPDGYQFSKQHRNWIKNMNRYTESCRGVDLTRNWPCVWRFNPNFCSDEYAGPDPNSEQETKNIVGHMDKLYRRIRVFISLRSYGQFLAYPWAFTHLLSAHDHLFHSVAQTATYKLSLSNGTQYKFGPIARMTLAGLSGYAVDYAYSRNVSYPFEFWLRNERSYKLARRFIIPTAVETMDGVTSILEQALED